MGSDIEHRVLAEALHSPEFAARVVKELTVEAFRVPRHRELFRILEALARLGFPIDLRHALLFVRCPRG